MRTCQNNEAQAAVLTLYLKPLFILALMIGLSGIKGIPMRTMNPKPCFFTNPNTVFYNLSSHTQSAQAVESVLKKGSLTGSVDDKTASDIQTTEKKNQTPFYQMIVDAANRHQVEPEMVQAIIMAESSFDPKAVSPCGAGGLMQLMPRTAKSLGVKDLFNPMHNIEGGVRYFKRLLTRFDNNVELALAAYNAGSRKVRKFGGIPPYKETRVYVKKVLRYYKTYKADPLNLV